MVNPPAKSTIHALLDRHGLVKRQKRRRRKAQGTVLSDAQIPNGLWCTSSKDMAPIGPFSKRHFSAGCFSSLTC